MKITSAFFPYGAGENPYQHNLENALQSVNVGVVRVANRKPFPYWQLKDKALDVVHQFWPHDLYSGRNLATKMVKRLMFQTSLPVLSSKRVVYSADNLISHESNDATDDKRWIQKIVSRSDGFVFMSQASRTIFREFYDVPERSQDVVVPHIRFNYEDKMDRRTAREQLDIPMEAKVLLSLGRINRYKGIHDLIRTVQRINDENVLLLVVGKCSDADLWQELTTLAAEHSQAKVKIVNAFVATEDLQKYFNASDAALCNYTDVPLNPGSPVMAMGFGCCIVGTNKGALPEIVPEEAFFGFEPGSVQKLRLAIEKLFGTNNLPELRGHVKNHICTVHSLENVGASIRDLYERVLAS